MNLPKTIYPPKHNTKLNEIEQLFVHTTMFKLGIVPIENVRLDMRKPLETLSKEESRAMKRKFRKLWRKLVKREIKDVVNRCKQLNYDEKRTQTVVDDIKQRYGMIEATPEAGAVVAARRQKNNRKKIVFDAIWHAYVSQMLSDFYSRKKLTIVDEVKL